MALVLSAFAKLLQYYELPSPSSLPLCVFLSANWWSGVTCIPYVFANLSFVRVWDLGFPLLSLFFSSTPVLYPLGLISVRGAGVAIGLGRGRYGRGGRNIDPRNFPRGDGDLVVRHAGNRYITALMYFSWER